MDNQEPSTKPLVTALMLALGRAAELYDQCRKDGQTDTVIFETIKHTHYVLSGIIEDYPDAPEDSRPILAAYETVIAYSKTTEYKWNTDLPKALAVLGVSE